MKERGREEEEEEEEELRQSHGCKSEQMVDWHYTISSPSVWGGRRGLASFLLLISQVFPLGEKHHRPMRQAVCQSGVGLALVLCLGDG